MSNPKIDKVFAAVCWLGTALVLYLESYMYRMSLKFPAVESFPRNMRLLLPLLALWLIAAAWFTALAVRHGKKRGKKDGTHKKP